MTFPEHFGKIRLTFPHFSGGGMGIVFRATHDVLGVVAVKFIRPESGEMNDPAACERFLAEAKLAAALRHPWIVTVHDADTAWSAEGVRLPYYVMEFVPGAQGLTTYARSRGLSMQERIALFVKVCEAVQHAHLKGVFHRDLKPSNILVDTAGHPRVIDFGIAHALGMRSVEPGLGPIGTLAYMSPEQTGQGAFETDTRSDVYSLGVILYELLAGRLPIRVPHDDLKEAIRRIMHDPPPPLRSLAPGVPDRVADAVDACLAKHPANRPQSAGDLARLLTTEGGFQHEPARTTPRRDAAWRTGLAFGGSIVVGVAAALAAGWTLPAWVPTAAGRGAPVNPVAVIGWTDATPVDRLVAESGVPADLADKPGRERAVAARLFERLAEVKPSVVAVDFFYKDARPEFDGRLAAAAAALQKAVPTIFIARLWFGGAPEVIEPLRDTPRFIVGGYTITKGDGDDRRLDAAVRRGDQTIPSMALLAYAQWRHPGTLVEVTTGQGVPGIRLEYADTSTGSASRIGVETVAITSGQASTITSAEHNREPGDYLALTNIPIFTDEQAKSVTIDIADALSMPPSELQQKLAGRVVVYGQLRTADGAPIDGWRSGGRMIFGAHVQAAAIAALLNSSAAVVRAFDIAAVVPLAAALAGACLLPFALSGPARRMLGVSVWRTLAVAGPIALAAAALAWQWASASGRTMNVYVPAATIVAALACFAWWTRVTDADPRSFTARSTGASP